MDDAASLIEVRAIGDADFGLNTIAWVREGVIDDLAAANDGVWYDHHTIIACAYTCRACTDTHHIPPGVQFMDSNTIVYTKRLVKQDDHAVDHIRDGILGG